MVNLINISYDEYIRKYGSCNIICIGAGGTFNNFVNFHMDKVFLLNKIERILDNNEKIIGTEKQVLNRFVSVQYLPAFDEKISPSNWIVFVLVADDSVVDVVKQLDCMNSFDGVNCVYGIGSFRWGYSFFPSPKYRIQKIESPYEYERIPRVIHYCWFGEKEIPDKDKKCIESFEKYNPGYAIKKWSEDNFDIENSPAYVQEAYRNKKYAFVSDYVRLAVVYKHGGIYLDTDVELFSSLDFFLKFRMVFAYMEYGELATGLGFASEANTQELFEMLKMYESIPFELRDNKYNETPCPRYTNEYFRRKGMYLDNSLDICGDILFLSSDYLCPLSPVEDEEGSYQLAQLSLTERTVGIHWCNNSWKDDIARDVFLKIKNGREHINQRLLMDWKRMKGLA